MINENKFMRNIIAQNMHVLEKLGILDYEEDEEKEEKLLMKTSALYTPENYYELRIHNTSGENMVIPLKNQNPTTMTIKTKIYKKLKILPENQELFYENNLLDDFDRIYIINNLIETVVILVDMTDSKKFGEKREEFFKEIFKCQCLECSHIDANQKSNLKTKMYLEQMKEDKDSFEVIRNINKGGAGIVQEIRYKSDDKKYALKIQKAGNPNIRKNIRNEFYLQKKLSRCKNICKLYYFIPNNDEYWAIFDLYDQDLSEMFEGPKSESKKFKSSEEFVKYEKSSFVDEKEVGFKKVFNKKLSSQGSFENSPDRESEIKRGIFLEIISQLTNSLAYMQKEKIIHRDIKPENVLISEVNGNLTAALADFGISEELEINSKLLIAGTRPFMSPEILYALRTEQTYFDLKLEKENIAVKTDQKFKFKKAFASDVFSFGLLWLYMADHEKFRKNCKGEMSLNSNSLALRNFIKSLKYFFAPLGLYKNLKKMLDFKPKLRPDFEAIEDMLIYSLHCPFKFFTPIIDHEEAFYKDLPVSGQAFQEFLVKSKSELNEMCYREELYYSVDIPFQYTKIVLDAGDQTVKTNYKELLNSLRKKFKITDKMEQGLEQRIKKLHNIKSFDDFEKLILLYTCESDFYKTLNKSLAANQFEDFAVYIKSIISLSQDKKYKKYEIESSDTVFRLCKIPKVNGVDNEYNQSIRSDYFPNVSYFWPGFTSTSKNFDKVLDLVNEEDLKNVGVIIFLIKLNLKNKRNKLDISSLNPFNEEEILLFPYFRFYVKDVKPVSFKFPNSDRVMHYKLIEVEELPEGNLPVRLIWFDPFIDNEENLGYQQMLKDVFRFNQANFFNSIRHTVDFIENAERNVLFFVISCGSLGKDLVDQIENNDRVSKVALFCSFKKKHQKWFTKKKYKKFYGIYTKFKEIQMILPKISY